MTLEDARESQHSRTTLGLVSRLWQDIACHTPSLWTTVYGLGTGHRNALTLIRSQNLPLDVYIDLSSWEGPNSLESFIEICNHTNRWRLADLTVPSAECLDAYLGSSAPLLEKLSIKAPIEEDAVDVSIATCNNNSPQLRCVLLSNITAPWDSRILSGLTELYLTNMFLPSSFPTTAEVLTILAACPQLSVLHLYCISIATTHSYSLPFVEVLHLRELRLTWLRSQAVRDILCHIQAQFCDIIQVVCVIRAETELSAIPAISDSILTDIPDKPDVSLTVGPREAMYHVHQSTHRSRRLQVVAHRRDTSTQTTTIVQHLVSSFPASLLSANTDLILTDEHYKLQINHIPPILGAQIALILPVVNRMHVISLTLRTSFIGLDCILKQLSSPQDDGWIFPSLRDVYIELDKMAVTPGLIPGMVEARQDAAASGQLPGPLLHVSVGKTGGWYLADRRSVEARIGHDKLVWNDGPCDLPKVQHLERFLYPE